MSPLLDDANATICKWLPSTDAPLQKHKNQKLKYKHLNIKAFVSQAIQSCNISYRLRQTTNSNKQSRIKTFEILQLYIMPIASMSRRIVTNKCLSNVTEIATF